MIRVGLIIEEGDLSDQVLDLIEKDKLSENYAISSFIIQRTNQQSTNFLKKIILYVKRNGIVKLCNRLSWSIMLIIDRSISYLIRTNYRKRKKQFLSEADFEIIKVYPEISASGHVYRYNKKDLEKIKDANLDVLIRFGNGILRGDILKICRYGILSYHHADNSLNRGGPPAFWEVFNREESTGFMIQQLTRELDGGNLLLKANIPTLPIFTANQKHLYEKSYIFMHNLLESIGKNNSLPPFLKKQPYSYPLYQTPSINIQFTYIFFRLFSFLIKKIVNRYFLQKRRRWSVAYQFLDDWQDVVLRKSLVIKNFPNRYFADPFIWKKNNRTICYVEDYNYTSAKGHIAAIELEEDNYKFLGPVIQEDYHLSYPFIFEYDDNLYMCPESSENNSIDLYRCKDFPSKWVFEKQIAKNISAVDTNIFEFNSKWWLFTNIDSSNIGEHCSELHIYYASNPLSGVWLPHKKNPVIFDSRIARNGGLIIEKNEIYRIYQKQDINLYGASMGVARIELLNESDYREVNLFEIPPKFFEKINGTHTLSFKKDTIAIDFAKNENFKK